MFNTRYNIGHKKVALVGVIFVALASIAVVMGYYLWPKAILPVDLTKQINFTIFVPTQKDIIVDKNSAKYDKTLELLSYNIVTNNVKTVVSMQPTPESFAEIPEAYDKVVASMNEYAKFENNLGVVRLTRPTDLDGKQAALLNAKGTLLFAKPESDLTDAQWRKLFSKFDVLKTD